MPPAVIISLVAMFLTIVATVVGIGRWLGAADEKDKSKSAEILALRGELASAKATFEKRLEERQRVGDEARKELREEIAEVKADMRRMLEARDTLIRLEERGTRVLEALDDVEGLAEDLGKLRDEMRAEVKRVDGLLSAYPYAAARLEWRVENVEEAVRKRLGSHPRVFAVRAEPERRADTKPTRALPAVEIEASDRPSFTGSPKPHPTARKGIDDDGSGE